MGNRVFIIMQVDLIYYPPALTLIKTLCDLKYMPIYVGEYSDEKQKSELTKRGVRFIDAPVYRVEYTLPHKFIKLQQFKRFVYHTLAQYYNPDSDLVWILNMETLQLVDKIVEKYKTIVQLYEFTSPHLTWKHYLLNPLFDLKKTLHKAYKIVHCEYNRAQITKGVYQLAKTPYVLPNKPYEEQIDQIPDDIHVVLDEIFQNTENKRVLLYQGAIQRFDRRLEEFCEAISELPEEYVLVIMGKKTPYAENLRAKYPSERILFAPFIRPPYHLLVTQMASIGILSYISNSSIWQNVINTIYCAPNKIFEYAKYNKPMIANDIPGLKYIFSQYQCGEVVEYPLKAQEIVEKIHTIEIHYPEYANNARKYYDSIQLPIIIQEIVGDGHDSSLVR